MAVVHYEKDECVVSQTAGRCCSAGGYRSRSLGVAVLDGLSRRPAHCSDSVEARRRIRDSDGSLWKGIECRIRSYVRVDRYCLFVDDLPYWSDR